MNNSAVRIVLVVALMALCGTSYGQYTSTAHDARSGAMGGCFMIDDTLRCIAVDYRRTFMLGEMADKGLSLRWPMGRVGVIGAGYRRHGNVDYHEQAMVVGYGMKVASWLKVTVGAQYLHVGTSDAYYEPQRWLAAGAAVQASAGRWADITLMAASRPWAMKQPWRMSAQMACRPTTSLLTVVEADWEEQLRWRLGLEYSYRDLVYARAGLATNPMVATFGLGIKWQWLSVDLGTEVHRVLGITPQTTLTLWF